MKFFFSNLHVFFMTSLLVFLLVWNSCAMMGGEGDSHHDPLTRINYRAAFDHTKIDEKFENLLNRVVDNRVNDIEGLDPGRSHLPPSRRVGTPADAYILLDFPQNIAQIFEGNEWKKYQRACLSKLQNARRVALLEPARESATLLVLIAGAVVGSVELLGVDSYGGSISIFAGFLQALQPVRTGIRSLYDLAFTPTHPLDDFERQFALNHCFIPDDLKPSLIRHFMTARQNPMMTQKSLEFIEFTLGLTIYRQQLPVSLSCDEEAVLPRISHHIDKFFESYPHHEPFSQELLKLKGNVFLFIKSLLCKLDKKESPRHIYLYGVGGVGKTKFANCLYEWISEIFSNSILFERFSVTSSDELEGNAERPGIFLRALRNQCLGKKNGSIILLDEGDWLNSMVSPAKRVFNGNLAEISTAFFGAGVDGTGIHLRGPRSLVIVCSNNEVEDSALRDRFDKFTFPLPTSNALLEYGASLLGKSALFQGRKIKEREINFIKEKIRSLSNFREIEAIIPTLALTIER